MLERDLGDTKAALGADGEIRVKLAVGGCPSSVQSVGPKGARAVWQSDLPGENGCTINPRKLASSYLRVRGLGARQFFLPNSPTAGSPVVS